MSLPPPLNPSASAYGAPKMPRGGTGAYVPPASGSQPPNYDTTIALVVQKLEDDLRDIEQQVWSSAMDKSALSETVAQSERVGAYKLVLNLIRTFDHTEADDELRHYHLWAINNLLDRLGYPDTAT